LGAAVASGMQAKRTVVNCRGLLRQGPVMLKGCHLVVEKHTSPLALLGENYKIVFVPKLVGFLQLSVCE